MSLETFVSSYSRDFGWPWPFPIQLTARTPPKFTISRPRECPTQPSPSCTCPEHTWDDDAEYYTCLAHKEARLHQCIQGTRAETDRCLRRKEVETISRRQKYPPLPKTIYQTDYTRKDTVPALDFVGLMTELVSSGVPAGPLGRSNFAPYDDPTKYKFSMHASPMYDPTRPIEESPVPDVSLVWYHGFPMPSEYMDTISRQGAESARTTQSFIYPLPVQLASNHWTVL